MKKILLLLMMICMFVITSCNDSSKPMTLKSGGETSNYKYDLIKQYEDDTYFIIEYEIEFKEGNTPLAIKRIEFSDASKSSSPQKIKIDDEEMAYQENISLSKTSFIMSIYENKSPYGETASLHYHISIEYENISTNNIFTSDIEYIVSYPKDPHITAF